LPINKSTSNLILVDN